MEAIKIYLKEIKNIPLLTAKDEIDLSRLIKKGDQEARLKMIRSNLRLVINIAKRYGNFGLPLIDLIEEGNLGLMKAVDKFNPKKGYRFSTYAAWWIRQSITRALFEQSKTVRVPVYMSELISKWNKTKEALSQKLKRAPSTSDIARKMHLPIDKVRDIRKWITKTASLDAPIGEDGDGQVMDMIKDESSGSSEDEISQFINRDSVSNLLGQMNEKEKQVLDLRFGLTNGRSYTLAEVAKDMEISRERVRQIEENALKKLRKFISQEEKDRTW
ncbi:MAG: RNA polymerase sigma factor RpoD/SigA [Candidatus Omnitrophota bacterium]